ncbi:MAG TPA: alpha/beta hydrolase [Nitrospirota bacterium]
MVRPACHVFVRYRIVLSCLFVTVILSGCGYGGFYARQAHWQQTYTYLPSMSALNKAAPENSLVLAGEISMLQKRHEPLLLVAISNQYRENEKVAVVQLRTDISYLAFLPPGDYDLFVFADLDRNKDFESNERVGQARVTISPDQAKSGIVAAGPLITLDFEHPGKVDFHLSETVRPAGYVYASLDDEFFDPQNGVTGLYNPSELIARAQGFLFSLEDYDENKTTILFVHGIEGTPRDWKFLVAGLDRGRFQPFFFYYPSGLPLDKLGSLLARILETMGRSAASGHKTVLVAHSMGGLVALSAINHLASTGLPPSLAMYCSFSAPYEGDDSIRKWIDSAPVVVPSWRDIAAPNDFLRDLTGRPFPGQLPFYLFFSYHDTSKFKLGESSDGAVTLRSQLAPPLQATASKVIGFNETHIGILNSEAARKEFLRLLETAAPSRRSVDSAQ